MRAAALLSIAGASITACTPEVANGTADNTAGDAAAGTTTDRPPVATTATDSTSGDATTTADGSSSSTADSQSTSESTHASWSTSETGAATTDSSVASESDSSSESMSTFDGGSSSSAGAHDPTSGTESEGGFGAGTATGSSTTGSNDGDSTTSSAEDAEAGSAAGTTGSTGSHEGSTSSSASTTGPETACGDGVVEADELCDDGNQVNGDACNADCTPRQPALRIATGGNRTCAVLEGGGVRCWGYNGGGDNVGLLGYPDEESQAIGDDEPPSTMPEVVIGAPVVDVVVGAAHTCALTDAGAVRCWGVSDEGELGYGNTDQIGDDEHPQAAGDVQLGGPAQRLAVGANHSCALLASGEVRCWGRWRAIGAFPWNENVGDDELPTAVPPVPLGGNTAIQIAASTSSQATCALTDGGEVYCWGASSTGALGQPSVFAGGRFGAWLGDDEFADALGPVALGEPAELVALGQGHSCALVAGGAVRCWGYGFAGALGYGNTDTIGDDEAPDGVGIVDVGAIATELALGADHTCIVTNVGGVRCWGAPQHAGHPEQAALGQLIGDDEVPADVPAVDIGGIVVGLAAGDGHTCALIDTGAVRCWGSNAWGELGIPFLPFPAFIGDDEPPSAGGEVGYF